MSDYRCRNVVFIFDNDISFINLNGDLELQEGLVWTKVADLAAEFHMAGLEDFRNQVVNYVRGQAQQDHTRRTTLAAAKTQLEGATFTVD